MENLSFENRVSISRKMKSEDLFRSVEELSSSYTKREKLAFNKSLECKMYTSEVCTYVFACAAAISWIGAAIAALIAEAFVVAHCETWVWDCPGGETAMVESVIYKNIV